MPRLTPSDLRRMPASQVIDLLEERLGARIPMELQLKISMLMGAGDQGIRVIDPCPGGRRGPGGKLRLGRGEPRVMASTTCTAPNQPAN